MQIISRMTEKTLLNRERTQDIHCEQYKILMKRYLIENQNETYGLFEYQWTRLTILAKHKSSSVCNNVNTKEL